MTRLRDFRGVEGTDFFEADRGLQRLLRSLLPESQIAPTFASLHSCALRVSGPWHALAAEASRPERLPRIVGEDRVRNRVERVELPLETRRLRRDVAESGVLTQARGELHRFALVYLLAHNGEASLMCPIACTDGLLRVLSAVGDAALRDRFHPQAASIETPFACAQFVTDQAGGSDVGAIETVAEPAGDGTWLITGEKWFCSNPDELFLVAARPRGAPAGTKGVALFLVPRVRPDGTPNALRLRRLKDKLGTRSLPTAEVDFEGALGFPVGRPEDGFRNLMTHVLNVSRLHNAANALGFVHRAFLEARNYARQREAFGSAIGSYPLVQESLLGLRATLERERVLFFRLVALIDAHGLVPPDREQRLWQRCLVNLAKYRTARALTPAIREAILVLGGNGVVEDFTLLPRLLRDALVIETWEGTHNTLCLQLARDFSRFDFRGRWGREVQRVLEGWPPAWLGRTRRRLEEAFRQADRWLAASTARPWVEAHARRLVDGVAAVLAVAWMADLARRARPSDAAPALLTAVAADQAWGSEAERLEGAAADRLREAAARLIDGAELPPPVWIEEV